MSKLGSWGHDLVFRVDGEDDVLQPSDTEETYDTNISEQSRYGKRPKEEFISMTNDQVKMTVKASAFFGESPERIRRRLKRAQERGKTNYLILGGRRVVDAKLFIKTLSVRRNQTLKRGQLASAEIEITFQRYT